MFTTCISEDHIYLKAINHLLFSLRSKCRRVFVNVLRPSIESNLLSVFVQVDVQSNVDK